MRWLYSFTMCARVRHMLDTSQCMPGTLPSLLDTLQDEEKYDSLCKTFKTCLRKHSSVNAATSVIALVENHGALEI